MTNETKNSPSRENVKQMFNDISSTYDKINRILSFGMDLRWRKKLRKHLPPCSGGHLVDLACGSGDQTKVLLPAKQFSSYTGVDIAKDMLEVAKRKLPSVVTLLEASCLELPLDNESADCTTMSFGIRNMTDTMQSLTEMYRILKPGGRSLILEFSLPRSALIRIPALFYLRHILPFIGNTLSKHPNAYTYLNQTIETFPSGEDFLTLMRQAGFRHTQATRLSLGLVTLYQGDK